MLPGHLAIPSRLAFVACLAVLPVAVPAVPLQVSLAGQDRGNCKTQACASLRYAISQAVDGDQILVGPGTYTGPGNRNLNTNGKAGLTIISTDGRDATIFDLQRQGRFFQLDAAAGATLIQGLTVVRGNCSAIPLLGDDKANGAGFRFQNSRAIVRDVAVRNMDCKADGVNYPAYSGAAFCFQDSMALVEDSLTEDNIANHGAGAATWGNDRSVVRNSVFLRSEGTFWGGALLTEENSTTEFRNCRFSYFKSDYGAGLDDGAYASPLFKDVIFEYGVGRYGAGLYHYGFSTTRYDGVLLQHNSGLSGTVYTNSDTLPSLKNVTFFNNTSTAEAPAIRIAYAGKAPMLLWQVRVIQNSATEWGGGVTVYPTADITFQDCLFDGNVAMKGDGGALVINGIGTSVDSDGAPRTAVKFLNTTFVRNSATANGGAFLTLGLVTTAVTFENCTFQDNVGKDGGAVHLGSPGVVNFTNTRFIGNRASRSGGAIKVKNLGQVSANHVFFGTTFEGNTAVTTGGALSCEEPNVEPPPPPQGVLFDGFQVRGSKVIQDGGGFHIVCTNLFMRNGTFEGNVAVEGNGGALVVAKTVNCSGATPSSPIFDSVALRNNSAKTGGGGGVYFDHTAPRCRMPVVEAAAAGGTPALAWRWRDAAAAADATANNTASFGDLQATPPARIELVCMNESAGSGCDAAPAGSNASVVIPAGYPGIRLALSVSMRDGFSQRVTSTQLQVAVVLGADDGTHFLEGVQRYWFENGEAAVSEVSLTGPSAQTAVPVDIVIPQAIASALGLEALPAARVLLTVGPCPAGYIGASSAAAHYTCGACPTGRFAIANAKSCASCEAGQYSDTTGSSSCSTCPPGHRCPPGTTSPLPCPLGSYQADAGSDVCNRCDRGSYQELDEQTACVQCPAPHTTLNNGAQSFAECVCPAGFYGNGGNGTCLFCSKGMDCPAGSMAPEQEDGYFLKLTSTSGFEAYRCLPRQCLAGRAGLCAVGRQGLACAECQEDHMPKSNGECVPCKNNQIAAPLVLAAICLVVIVGLYFAAGSNVNKQSYTQLTVLATGGQLLLTVQTIASLNSLQVVWVEPMATIMEGLGILRFRIDVLQVQCVVRTDNPVAKYGMTLLVIPALCILLLLMFGLMSLIFRQRKVGVNGVINALGLIVTICYLPITIVCFSVMQCVRNPGGTFTLATMPSVVCGGDKQQLMLALGVINLVLLPIPVLCGVSLLTYIYPSIVANGGASVLLQRFRFIYQRFAPNCYYYAVLYMYRSFLVVLPPVIFPEPGAIQILVLGLIIAGFFGIQCVLWPWRTRLSNVLDAIFGYVLILLLMITATLVVAPPDKLATDIGAFQYCVLVLFVGGSVAVFGICLWKICRRHRKKYGMFLSHHKGGASALARLMRSHLESAAKCIVFLDCDHLETLDALFDIVRVDTERVVLILTEETLRRVWCAGELVTARQAGVPIIPMHKPGYEGLSDTAIQNIDTFWTPDDMMPLTVAGINYDSVRETYLHLRTLEQVEMPGELQCENDLAALRACFGKVIKLCSSEHISRRFSGGTMLVKRNDSRKSKGSSEVGKSSSMASVVSTVKTSSSGATPRRTSRQRGAGGTCVGIVVDSGDMEAVCRAMVLQQFVMAETQWESQIFLSAEELQRSQMEPSGVLVVLTKGCLTSPRFACLLVLVRRMWPEVASVTVLADMQFSFPEKKKIASDVVPLAVRGEDMLNEEEVAEAYGQVLNVLALPFFAESNIGAIKIAAARISERVERKMGPQLSSGELDARFKEANQPGCIDVLRAGFSGPGGVEGLLIAQARKGARAYPEEPMAGPGQSPPTGKETVSTVAAAATGSGDEIDYYGDDDDDENEECLPI